MYFRYILCRVVFALLLILMDQKVMAISPADASSPINAAAIQLVKFCNDPKIGLDEHALTTLVDYVLASKLNREYALPKFLECTGAYYEFDTKIAFPRFMEYFFNPLIPSVITRPGSLRYSIWTAPRGEMQQLPNNWKPVSPAAVPVVIHGMQHEANTPDLSTGVYHEYDLKRTLILLNHKGRQALVSISKQVSTSNVGKKGVILGDDNDWNYYYSGEPGTPRFGIGWVKSYIYDYFSIGVYVESSVAPVMVRTGVFQWLRAGWTGINFVQSNHILGGMRRFARNCKMVLESTRLPAPNQMICVYQWLSNMPPKDLIQEYAVLQQAQRSSAIQVGKISKSEGKEQFSFADTPKEQVVEELMLEYLKMIFGKPTPLGKQFFLLAPICNL